MSVERLRNPWDITTFIKQQKGVALSSTRGSSPEAGLTGFCDSMDDLLSAAGSRMNYINFSAVITGTAQTWAEAQRNDSFKGDAAVFERLERLYQRCLRSLQPLLADVGAQGCSTVLWSSATLGLSPDDIVPGMVHALTSRFLQFIDVAEEKQRPQHRQLPMCCGLLQQTVIQQQQHRWWALSACTLGA